MTVTSLSDLEPLARSVLDAFSSRKLMIATAESCTGGMICALLTEIAGSSAVVDRGFITYSNEAKTEMLGVAANLIAQVGAVSKDVAIAMAEGALEKSKAHAAVSVTGIAGPGGGSTDKPVGTVHMAIALRNSPTRHILCQFSERSRSAIRLESVQTALTSLLEAVNR